jgi:hypothetical protein
MKKHIFMKKQIAPNAVLTLLISLCTLTSAFAQEAVINKIFNSGYKSTGDSDVVEILVVKHKLNMKGMIIRDYAENEGSFVKNARQETGGFIFAEREEWSGLQAGTLLVLSITTEGFQKFGDTVIRCGMRNSQYFRRLSPQTDFNIGQEDVIELKSGDSAHTSIHALAVGFTNKKRPKFPKLLFTPEKTVGKKSQIIRVYSE